MKSIKSWETITNIGLKIKEEWLKLSKKHNLKITTGGIPAFINFQIESRDWLKYKTYLTQEMLKKGFLASNSVYACIDHKDETVEFAEDPEEPIEAPEEPHPHFGSHHAGLPNAAEGQNRP